MPFMAARRLGQAHRAHHALAREELRRRGQFRGVLIHHPPLPGQARSRRGLRDSRALKNVLKEHGAELVLQGLDQCEIVHVLETATGTAMFVGLPSASEAVAGRIPAARYNEYRIDKVAGGWRCDMVGRAVADTAAHVWECEHRVLLKP
jgi:3',5'-cyclic AMP phosphodiesterase CpdA